MASRSDSNFIRKIFRPAHGIILFFFVAALSLLFWGYGQMKGPLKEQEIQGAQQNATAFQGGELTIGQGRLQEIKNYFFLGRVYVVETPRGSENMISFITPDPPPELTLGGQIEWVGKGNYLSSISQVQTREEIMEGEIMSLERISPKNNTSFYCVVHSWQEDLVQRFIVSSDQLSTLKTYNSVRVSYRSPADSRVEILENTEKVAVGFIRDLWLTSEISSLDLEGDFDFEKYPYYISVAPSANPKYTWTFYLTEEQRYQVKLGNMVEVRYDSRFPISIRVTSEEVDPQLLTDNHSHKSSNHHAAQRISRSNNHNPEAAS